MKKTMVSFLVTGLLLLHAGNLFSQNLTNQGTDFWFGFMRNHSTEGCSGTGLSQCSGSFFNCSNVCTAAGMSCPCITYGDVNLLVYVSSNEDTDGQIIFPDGTTQNFNVQANATTTINVPISYLMLTNEAVENKGLRVTTNAPSNVFALNHRDASSDASIIVPRNTLRGDYYVMAHAEQPDNQGVQRIANFLIVGVEDDTQIDITLPPGVSTVDGRVGTWSVTLDAGQTYQVRSVADPTGAYVTSVNYDCKPFALFGGNDFTRVGNCGSTRDHLFAQMYPTATWGRRYITLPYVGRQGDYAKIISLVDNNPITINGTQVATLNRQEQHFVLLTQPSIVEGQGPIAVGQFARTQGCDGTQTDPFFVNLSSVEQLQITDATFSAFNDPIVTGRIQTQYINLYTPANSINSVRINGVNRSADFTPLDNTPYAYARIQVSKGNHRIQADSGFVAFLYGWGDAESYGYPGGVVLNNLNLRVQSEQNGQVRNEVCADVPVNFSSTSIATVTSWEWDFGDGSPVTNEETPTHTYSSPGVYFVKLKSDLIGACAEDSTVYTIRVRRPNYQTVHIQNNSCLDKDSLDVTLNYRDASIPLTVRLNGEVLTNDSTVIRGLQPELYTLSFIDGTGCIADTTLDLRMHTLDSLKASSILDFQNLSCHSAKDGSIYLSPPSGGTGRYRFSIDQGDTWFPDTSYVPVLPTDSILIDSLAAGEYTVWVRDDSIPFCVVPYPTVMLTQPDTLVAILDLSEPGCQGNNTFDIMFESVTGSASGNYDYRLNGNTWEAFSGQDFLIGEIPVGTYQLELRTTENPDCIFLVLDTTINPYEPLTATQNATSPTGCTTDDGMIELSDPTGGSGNYLFRLNEGSWQPSGQFQNLDDGSYAVFIQDADRPECIELVDSVTLSSPEGINGQLIVSNITACDPPWDGEVTFTNLVGATTGNYEFSLDGGNSWVTENPITEIAPGVYGEIIVRDADNTDCDFLLRDSVTFVRPDNVEIGNDTSLCIVPGALFVPITGLPAGGVWTASPTLPIAGTDGGVPMDELTTALPYTFRYTSPEACPDSFVLVVHALPNTEYISTPASFDTLYLPNASLNLLFPDYEVDDTLIVDWGDGISNVHTSNVLTYTYSEEGVYDLSVRAINENDCEGVLQEARVVVLKPDFPLKLPNVFTPNGDGHNDEWRVELQNATSLSLHIFNRWGVPIYTASVQGTSLIWNGRTANGEAPAGVYFYQLRYTQLNGNRGELSGNVTLLR